MQTLKKFALLLGALALVFMACTDTPTDSDDDDQDTVEPSLTVLTLNDTVLIDTVRLTGTASDESGIDRIYATVNNNKYNASFSNSQWTVDVPLRPGENIITVTAEDNVGNTREKTTSVYYKTNYFPINDSSYWKFQGAQAFDSLVIAVDSSAPILGSIHLYRLHIINYLRSESDTIYLLYNDGAYKMHKDIDSLLDTDNILFLEEYSPTPQNYNNKSVTFVGDTTINQVDYRNCIRVNLIQSERLARISAFYLVPYLGLIAVYANDELYPLESP